MSKKLIYILIILLPAYGIFSCTLSDIEKKRIREERSNSIKENDIHLFSEILKNKNLFNANIKWIKNLGFIGNKKTKYIELYTSQIQDAFMQPNPTLIFGDILDFEIKDSNTYTLTISNSSFLLEMRHIISPNLRFQLACPKHEVDKIILDFNSLYKKIPGFGIKVAAISKFSAIKDYSTQTTDGEKDEGKLLIGDCTKLMLSPQGIGFLRKSLSENFE
jgi:hypothetical protein